MLKQRLGSTPLLSKISSRSGIIAGLAFTALFGAFGFNVVLNSLAATTPASADVNKDGKINIFDLSAVIAAWGLTGTRPADVNGDGAVSIFDISGVLANWTSGAGTPTPTATATPSHTPTPTPTATPPTSNRGPSGPVVVWEDNFNNGFNCNIWVRVQNNDTGPNGTGNSACSALSQFGTGTATDGRTRFPDASGFSGQAGDRAGRFEVRGGDIAASGMRSELSGDGASWVFHDGYEGWLQMRIKKGSPGMHDVILAQFHAGSGSPPLKIGLKGSGEFTVESLGVGSVPGTVAIPASQFPVGTWFDIDLHFKMSNDPSKGGAQVYVNGVDKTGWIPGRTMGDSDSYLKIGQYCYPRSGTFVAWADDVRLTRR